MSPVQAVATYATNADLIVACRDLGYLAVTAPRRFVNLKCPRCGTELHGAPASLIEATHPCPVKRGAPVRLEVVPDTEGVNA